MKTEHKDTAFIDAAKAELDAALDTLDPSISSRLRRSRHRALEAATQKRPLPWMLPAAGFAAVSVGILAFFLLLQSPKQKELVSKNLSGSASSEVSEAPEVSAGLEVSGSVEDLELLASLEAIEFYDELEFYGWLAAENPAA